MKEHNVESRRQRIRELRARKGRSAPVCQVAEQLRAEGWFRSDLCLESCERTVRRDLGVNRKQRRLGRLAPVLRQFKVWTVADLRRLSASERIVAAQSQVDALAALIEETDDPTARDQAKRRIEALDQLIHDARTEELLREIRHDRKRLIGEGAKKGERS